MSRGDTQDLAPQIRALTGAGCYPIYQEEASGGQSDRRELARAIGALTPEDVLVVWKLDRLSRSLRDPSLSTIASESASIAPSR